MLGEYNALSKTGYNKGGRSKKKTGKINDELNISANVRVENPKSLKFTRSHMEIAELGIIQTTEEMSHCFIQIEFIWCI